MGWLRGAVNADQHGRALEHVFVNRTADQTAINADQWYDILWQNSYGPNASMWNSADPTAVTLPIGGRWYIKTNVPIIGGTANATYRQLILRQLQPGGAVQNISESWVNERTVAGEIRLLSTQFVGTFPGGTKIYGSFQGSTANTVSVSGGYWINPFMSITRLT